MLPQYVVTGPDGKHLGTYEARHEAEGAIQADLQARAALYSIDDSVWRAQEAAENQALADQARFQEAEAVLAAEAEREKVRKEALAIVNEKRS